MGSACRKGSHGTRSPLNIFASSDGHRQGLRKVRARHLLLSAQAAFVVMDSATARPCAGDAVRQHSWSRSRADPQCLGRRLETWVRPALCDSGVQILDPGHVRPVLLRDFSWWCALLPCLCAGLKTDSRFGFSPGYWSSGHLGSPRLPPRSWPFHQVAGEASCYLLNLNVLR